jgi:dihydroorotate dehydrogenase electron transfer subunit
MKIDNTPVTGIEKLTATVYALHFESPYITQHVQPGQFVNIRVENTFSPLLRRPFSIAWKEGTTATILFDVVGEGTRILSEKKRGNMLDVLGPLGKPYTMPDRDSTVILVAGGLGMAPMPLLTQALNAWGVDKIHTFLGARTKEYLVDYKLGNIQYATDDNSRGYNGTVVSLVDEWLRSEEPERVHAFACGPNPMLKALQTLLQRRHIQGQVSLECVMACGVGICQGCPVETTGNAQRYRLVCKEGPVFDIQSVRIA